MAFENLVGKGENAGNIFFFSHNLFYSRTEKFHVLSQM